MVETWSFENLRLNRKRLPSLCFGNIYGNYVLWRCTANFVSYIGFFLNGDWFMQRGQTPNFAHEIIYTPYFCTGLNNYNCRRVPCGRKSTQSGTWWKLGHSRTYAWTENVCQVCFVLVSTEGAGIFASNALKISFFCCCSALSNCLDSSEKAVLWCIFGRQIASNSTPLQRHRT
jgi:hypothetical protein